MTLNIDAKFKENGLVLSNMTLRIWQIFVHRLNNSDFNIRK